MGFVSLSHEALFVDKDDTVIEAINSAKPLVNEDGLEELMKKYRGKYLALENVENAVFGSDIVFIAVNTPTLEDGSVDLSHLVDAAMRIGRALERVDEYRVIVVKSTVPPGTTENVVKPVLEERSGKRAFHDFGLAMNPEFLKEGSAIKDFLSPDRIVIGVNDEKTRAILEQLYNPIKAPKIIVDIRTAEMIKYASNTFLAVKISFANEIGNLCKRLGIDSWKVLEAVGLDHRIGLYLLKAGLGWGGPRPPEDTRALIRIFKENGEEPLILEAAYRVNREQVRRLVSLLKKHMTELKGRKIGILGLAYKLNVNDVRGTLAVEVIQELINEGASIITHDPAGVENFESMYPEISQKITFAHTPEEALSMSDALVIVTDRPQYEKLDYNGKIVIDGRRVRRAEITATVYEGLCW